MSETNGVQNGVVETTKKVKVRDQVKVYKSIEEAKADIPEAVKDKWNVFVMHVPVITEEKTYYFIGGSALAASAPALREAGITIGTAGSSGRGRRGISVEDIKAKLRGMSDEEKAEIVKEMNLVPSKKGDKKKETVKA